MTEKRNGRPWILMNPGPVNVTRRVRQALLKPDICHREEEFSDLLGRIRKKILGLCGISKTHTVALFTGSGTAALEAMLVSFARPDKKILVLSNGVYGERMRTILERHGSPLAELSGESSEFPGPDEIEASIKKDPSIHGIAMVHHETSTGMLNSLPEVAAVAKKYKKTLLLDAISSLGAEKIDFVKDAIGLCAGTSGKCLHSFPGVSFVIVSKEEVRRLGTQRPRSFYLDLAGTLEMEEKNDTPFTPAVQLFYAFEEALDELIEERLSRRIDRYAERSLVLERGFTQLGLKFLVEKKHRSHVLTALWMPPSVSYKELHDKLKKRGFVIYAGQSKLKDRIFRVSNLGDVQIADLKRFLTHLKKILVAVP